MIIQALNANDDNEENFMVIMIQVIMIINLIGMGLNIGMGIILMIISINFIINHH